MRIASKAPTRIDLAGGTLDLWPLFLLHENALTINVAVNLYAEAVLEILPDSKVQIISKDQRQEIHANNCQELNNAGPLPLHTRLIRYFAPDRGIRLETNCMAPAGSGLGGSSALAIAICGALNALTGAKRSVQDLIGISRDIEVQVLGVPTGVQDYNAAVYGGLSAWSFRPNVAERLTYSVPLSELQNRILLFFSGVPRNSGINNWHVFKNRIDGDPNVRDHLETIRNETIQAHTALQQEQWDNVFKHISNEWAARKKLAPSITTWEIENLIRFGAERGAKAAKVCGAGGGGCLFLMMDPDKRQQIQQEAESAGVSMLDFELVSEGLSVAER